MENRQALLPFAKNLKTVEELQHHVENQNRLLYGKQPFQTAPCVFCGKDHMLTYQFEQCAKKAAAASGLS